MENFKELLESELYNIKGKYMGKWIIGYDASTNQYINIAEISDLTEPSHCTEQKNAHGSKP